MVELNKYLVILLLLLVFDYSTVSICLNWDKHPVLLMSHVSDLLTHLKILWVRR